MSTVKRSKIKKLIKQQRKGFWKNCIIKIDLDAIPQFNFDIKYWQEMLMQKGNLLMNREPESFKIITFKPRKL